MMVRVVAGALFYSIQFMIYFITHSQVSNEWNKGDAQSLLKVGGTVGTILDAELADTRLLNASHRAVQFNSMQYFEQS